MRRSSSTTAAVTPTKPQISISEERRAWLRVQFDAALIDGAVRCDTTYFPAASLAYCCAYLQEGLSPADAKALMIKLHPTMDQTAIGDQLTVPHFCFS